MIPLVTKWRLAFYVVAIFSTGIVSGWVLAIRTARSNVYTPPRRDEVSEGFRAGLRKLDLAPDQKQRIDTLINRSSKEIWAIHDENMKRIKLVVSNRNAQVNALLTAEQQDQFAEIERLRREASRGTNNWRAGRNSWPGKDRDHDRDRGKRERGTNNSPLLESPSRQEEVTSEK